MDRHRKIGLSAQSVQLMQNRLISAQTQFVERKRRIFVEQIAKLDAMSPLKVLTRGYVMAQDQNGDVLRSVAQISVDDEIKLTLADGRVTATVTDREETAI